MDRLSPAMRSLRKFSTFIWIALAVSLTESVVAQQSASLQDIARALTPEAPVTIYPAREILTMDTRHPTATAVAVSGDHILAVGSQDDVIKTIGNTPFTINQVFADKVVVPGLIAQHMHPALAALTMRTDIISIEDWALPGGTIPAVRDRTGYLARLREADARLSDPDALLITWGFHPYFHGTLTRMDLDHLNARRPILVWHRSTHEFILNTAALNKYGIGAELIARQTPSAQKMMNLEEGHFFEQGMFPILPQIVPAFATPERLQSGLELMKTYMHANGITTGSDPGAVVSKPLQEAQNAIFSGADTPFRIYLIADGKTMGERFVNGNLIAETEKLFAWGAGNVSYLPRQAKLFADGAIFSLNMQMRDGYLDGHPGQWMMDPARYAKVFRQYWDAGYQIHTHQNGDKGLDMVLDNLEENLNRAPRQDHRTVVVHFGFSTPQQVERIKRLGAIVSANPYYVTALADKYSEIGLGPQRANEMVRLGAVKQNGIRFALHDDMPMAPAQPLFLMDAAVNRTTFSGRVAGADQRISPEDALRAVTIDAAYALQLEHVIGSIEPGKLANFTVLEESPLTVAPQKIKDIAVWGTVFEGRLFPVQRNARHQAIRLGPLERLASSGPAAYAFSQEAQDAHSGESAEVCMFNQQLAAAFNTPLARTAR